MTAQTADRVFPEIGGGVGLGGAREFLDLGELGRLLGRIVGGRGRRPELARRVQHPGLPHCHLWQDRIGPAPFARSRRHIAGPFDIGAIGFAAVDNEGGDLASKLETGADIAGILHAGEKA